MEAEERVKELESQVGEAQARAAQAEAALGAAQRSWALERELAGAGVIDAEAAAILALRGADPGASESFDAATAVAELKRRRPYLFAAAPQRASATSAAAAPPSSDTLAKAAEDARASGDPKALFKYLRMRRS